MNRCEADRLSLRVVGLPNETRSMTSPALYMQESLYTLVSQQRNKGLNARRTFQLIAFDSVDLLDRINGGARFTRQEFNFRFSGDGWPRI
jgi:hypothetical protein